MGPLPDRGGPILRFASGAGVALLPHVDLRGIGLDAAFCSRSVHDFTCGRLRSRALRSRSVIPPQTPNSMRLSSASARHSIFTGQPPQICLTLFCAAPAQTSRQDQSRGMQPGNSRRSRSALVLPLSALKTPKAFRNS